MNDIRKYIIELVELHTKAEHTNEMNVNMVLNTNIDFVDGVGYDKQLYGWIEKLIEEITEYNSMYFMVNTIRIIDNPFLNNGKRLQISVLFDDNRSDRVKNMEQELFDVSKELSHLLENDDFELLTIGKIKKRDMYDTLTLLYDLTREYRF